MAEEGFTGHRWSPHKRKGFSAEDKVADKLLSKAVFHELCESTGLKKGADTTRDHAQDFRSHLGNRDMRSP